MKLLYDTNILIQIAKYPRNELLKQIINPDNQEVFISIVSIAELKSIALQNSWGERKLRVINLFLNEVILVEVNESLTDTYVEIDAFSQCRNPSYIDYPFKTARNMGKNDLWIASTAALFGLKLVTTDADFNHLHQVFLEVQYIKLEVLK